MKISIRNRLAATGLFMTAVTQARADDIKLLFLSDHYTETITFTQNELRRVENSRSAHELVFSKLNEAKVDCGPHCVPKLIHVDPSTWQCCDGRVLPPSGKVNISPTNAVTQSLLERAFSNSNYSSTKR